jgi:predicted Zn finger-like uncharacterized protein
VKFLCDQCKAKYQIADEKVAGKTVRMKCRKCGHLIEVRAAVTESSVGVESAPLSTEVPAALAAAVVKPPAGAPAPARKGTPLPRPAAPPPRTGAAAGTPAPGAIAPGRPPAKPAAPSALAGAFKSNVQREEEVSTPFDMSELAPDDAWYVAINGVPVGPIKISEVRRKAALGAVTEDSLVWQEGQDEWRPARQLPDLAAIVREAASGRTSLTPPPGRSSTPPPPRSSSMSPMSPRPSTGASGASGTMGARGVKPPAGSPTSPSAVRNNVVPITSRLATAEKLEEPVEVGDPFALPPASASAAMAPPGVAVPIVASAVAAPPPEIIYRKQPPWLIVGMMVCFAAFGITAAVVFFRPAPPAPAPVIVQVPVAAPAATAQATASPDTTASSEATAPSAPTAKAAAGGGGPRVASAAGPAAPTSTGRSLDLHSLAQNSNVGPAADPGSDGPKAPGQCFSSGQVQQVIGLHQLAIRRACWERDPTTKPSVNVGVSMTIGADGIPQGVSASGDEASVAKCIENDVRGWHFPAMGCSQKTGFSFKFVRQ